MLLHWMLDHQIRNDIFLTSLELWVVVKLPRVNFHSQQWKTNNKIYKHSQTQLLAVICSHALMRKESSQWKQSILTRTSVSWYLQYISNIALRTQSIVWPFCQVFAVYFLIDRSYNLTTQPPASESSSPKSVSDESFEVKFLMRLGR